MPVLPKILRLEPRNVVPWSLLPLVGEIPHPIYLVVSELPAPSWPLRCGNVSRLESGPFQAPQSLPHQENFPDCCGWQGSLSPEQAGFLDLLGSEALLCAVLLVSYLFTRVSCLPR